MEAYTKTLASHPSLQTGIVYDPLYKEHHPGPRHPDRPERCDAVMAGIRGAVEADRLRPIQPRDATEDEVALCHAREYMEQVRRDVRSDVPCLSTGDTDVCEKSLDVALRAVGGVLAGIDAVMAGEVGSAFCAVRPPGHHATPGRGMGFCIFNSVAIGARYLGQRHGLDRVLIVDWDVHHGNGTQEIFYEDPSVFYFSTHEWPCYPGTGSTVERGRGPGKGFTLNCPVAAGSGRTEILGAFRDRLAPAMRQFRPEFILISAGFDGRQGDLLGHLCLTDTDFFDLTVLVKEMAQEYANGRVVSALEGGYELDGLARAGGAHVAALAQG